MSSVLVVQPDHAQAQTLRDIFRRVAADLDLVHSTGEATDAIAHRMPDLILLSTLLSPRDEDALMAHLRTLEGASHLQTLTLPQFRSAEEPATARKGLFGFGKKAKVSAPVGCDPSVFAEEVVAHLKRASEIRNRVVTPKPVPAVVAAAVEPAPVEEVKEVAWGSQVAWGAQDEQLALNSALESYASAAAAAPNDIAVSEAQPAAAASSDWPVWRNSAPESAAVIPVLNDESIVLDEPVALDEPVVRDEPVVLNEPRVVPAFVEPVAAHTAAPVETTPPASAVSEYDEIDRLARELGLNIESIEIGDVTPVQETSTAQFDDAFDFGAALDRARLDAEHRRAIELAEAERAEAERVAAIAEARAAAEREAREAVAADLARVQAEAEAMRELAVAEARAAAEREAREALAADLARVQAEAETLRETAIAEAKAAAGREARETLDVEIARVRSETELTIADALNKVKTEAEEAEKARLEAERLRVEAQEAFAAELARVRSEVEQQLAVQLEAARVEAERMRAAEAEAARDRAAVEAQLKAELDRLKFVAAQARKADESDTRKAAEQIRQLERELAGVHAKAEERQVAQLEELRAQMAEMREAAAQNARAAAAEAVAAEVARATAQTVEAAPARLNVIRMQPRGASQPAAPAETRQAAIIESVESIATDEKAAPEQPSGDYYSLWQADGPPEAAVDEPEEQVESQPIDFRRYAKWALPVAASLLLLANTGTAISTVTQFVTPAEKPALTVEPVVAAQPFSEVVKKRVGALRVESDPAGAEAVIDGRSYGKTPLTIPDLGVGTHTLVLKSAQGSVTRKVVVKPNETTLLSEAIFSGWLAIFSPIPVTAVVDGQPVNLTEDGRLMTTPGKHVVELISERFNFRSTQTLEVKPGETTAHTVALPMGSVRVSAPEGAEIRIDGQPAVGVPSEGLAVSVGSHEITAIHPELGERRVAVDVAHGSLTEVAVKFEP